MDFDGFDDFDFGVFGTASYSENGSLFGQEDELVQSIFINNHKGENIVCRRAIPVHLTPLLNRLFTLCPAEDVEKLKILSVYMASELYGKRNIRKEEVAPEELSKYERAIYNRIRKELRQFPGRWERIYDFVNQKGITARLINYFIVTYILTEQKVSYYLDKSSYPFRIIGQYNKVDQPDILQRIGQGEHIVWINLHQEYKDSKGKKGRRNRHAPYRRGTVVKGEDGKLYSLCELNFYLWMDDVGGLEAFKKFQDDVIHKKTKYNEEKRLHESNRSFGKRRKHKIILGNTDGRNYQTYFLEYEKPSPYSGIEKSVNTNVPEQNPFGDVYGQKRKAKETINPKETKKRRRKRYVSLRKGQEDLISAF